MSSGGEQPAVSERTRPQEVEPSTAADTGLAEHRGERLGLVFGREYGRADETAQILTQIEQRLERVELGLDLRQRALLLGEFEQRAGIAASNAFS